jgi:hypothetical protein
VVRYPGQKEFEFASFNETVGAMDGEDDRIENSKAERDLEVTRRARIIQQQCGTRRSEMWRSEVNFVDL